MDKITLDYRANGYGDKIAEIFDYYNTLDDGGEISLITESDPMKLYYEIHSKTNGNFYWVPIKDGPSEWEIVIEKPM